MSSIAIVLVAAFLAESMVQVLKPLYDKETGWNRDTLLALVVSILVCVAFGVDVFPALGIETSLPIIGSALTGVLVSRGANFAHDIITNPLVTGAK